MVHEIVAEADVVARVVRGLGARYEPERVPVVVSSDPELISVGLST